MRFKSKLEIDSETDIKTLIVIYDSVKDDFDAAINEALVMVN